MTPPIVVNKKTDEYDIFIGRPSKWGNPWIIGKHGSRAEVIKRYEKYARKNKIIYNSLHELDGKRIACFCSPEPCHGDILRKLFIERFGDDTTRI